MLGGIILAFFFKGINKERLKLVQYYYLTISLHISFIYVAIVVIVQEYPLLAFISLITSVIMWIVNNKLFRDSTPYSNSKVEMTLLYLATIVIADGFYSSSPTFAPVFATN